MARARFRLQALRALIAALMLWAAPARPASAAPLLEVPVLVVAHRAASPSAASHVTAEVAAPSLRMALAIPRRQTGRVRAPSLSARALRSPRYLLNCALLR
jgi:hypothetical protein